MRCGGRVVLGERRAAGARPGEGAAGPRRGVRAEREAPRVRAAGAVHDPSVAGGDREQPGGGGGRPVRVQGAQQRGAGAPGCGVGEPGLDQGPCLDPLPRYGGARRPEDPPFLVGLHRGAGAEEADDARPGQREQLPQPGPRRSGGEVAEEAVPLVPGVTEPDQRAVDREQSGEDGEVLAVPGVVPAGEVGLDVGADRCLEAVGGGVAHPVQRAVERRQVEPVGGVGDGVGDQVPPCGAARFGGRVLLFEGGPADGGALGVGGEQPVVVGVSELFIDILPYLPAEVERLRPLQRFRRPLGPEEARQRRPFPL